MNKVRITSALTNKVPLTGYYNIMLINRRICLQVRIHVRIFYIRNFAGMFSQNESRIGWISY